MGRTGRRFARSLLLSAVFGLCLVGASKPAAAVGGDASSTVTRTGVLHEKVADDFFDGTSTTRYSIRTSSGNVTRLLPTTLEAETGEEVTVSGQMYGGELVGAVEPAGGVSQPAVASAGSESLLRPLKVAVLMVKFPGDPEQPWEAHQFMREAVFTAPNSANAFYQDETYGQMSFVGNLDPEGDIFGPYTVERGPEGSCHEEAWQAAGEEAAEADGFVPGAYDRVILLYTSQGCGYFGLASGQHVYLNGSYGAAPTVVAHELGHTFGLDHASSFNCGWVAIAPENDCVIDEYGDPFDVMGSVRLRHSNGRSLELFGVLSPQNVEEVTQDGTYTISSALYPTDEPTLLKIPSNYGETNAASWYYLEIRQQGGYFEHFADGSTTGVSIRVGSDLSTPRRTFLIDTTPKSSNSEFEDAPLSPGQTFDDGDVRLTTLSAGNGTATVDVELGPGVDTAQADTHPPTRPSLNAFQVGSAVELNWTTSTDHIGVSRYALYRAGQLLGYFSSDTRTFLDTTVSPGRQTYVVYAEDAAGNRSEPSPSPVITVVDSQAPSSPPSLSAMENPDDHVQLQWQASSDDFGVSRYLVYRDGALIASTSPTATGFLDSTAFTGQHTYVVYAEDASENRSGPSPAATVTVIDSRAPSTPQDLTATAAAGGVVLQWQPSSDNFGVDRYAVYRDGELSVWVEDTTYTDAAASPGPHTYVVYAEDLARNRSEPSSAALATVVDSEAPTAPRNLTATARPDQVKLSWLWSKDNFGVSRYDVYRDGAHLAYTPVGTTTYSDSTASAGQHTYVVYAEDASANRSEPSAAATATVADHLAPSAPQDLIAVVDATGVELSWQPSSDDVGVSRYVFYRDGALLDYASAGASGFLDAAAPPGPHTYVAYAEDGAGNRSEPSAPATVVVVAPPSGGQPAPPPEQAQPGKPDKPILRVKRGRSGALGLEADARRDPEVVRLELWLNDRLLRSTKGRRLRVTLRPGDLPCASSFQVSAWAYNAIGAKASSKTRVHKAPCRAARDRRRREKTWALARDLILW